MGGSGAARVRAAACAALLALASAPAACSGGASDGEPPDGGANDAGAHDAGAVDAGDAGDGCTDGAIGPGETDVDCGGPCAPCADGRGCAVDADCEGRCEAGTCAPEPAADWVLVPTASAPTERRRFAMAYDAARARMVLFGGIGPSDEALDDTWTWDGADWTLAAPAGASPAPRFGHVMAYDAARAVVVLFGGATPSSGALDDTWEWDGAAWIERTSPARPLARRYAAMAYDAARGVVVLFGGAADGGSALGDTWEWDGAAWTERALPTSPPARARHAMAYDAARGALVLFGGGYSFGVGEVSLDDTWLYDGAGWSLAAPHDIEPDGRGGHHLAYDAARERTVLFGGVSLAGPFGDTWEWDGGRWTLMPGGGPAGGGENAMTYDATRARIVLHYAFAYVNYPKQTWEYYVP